ncbi:MAG: RAD55 family ATPase [Candidatus Freyarchaeota archaeon]|nr:RAD55 family ATPase [Candidatus Freyrarchaeum guaymaensis]
MVKGGPVKSGIRGLDSVLDGGFRPGSLCIVVGEPLGGKELFALKFFCEGLELGDGGIYVTAVNFAEEIEAEISDLGLDLSKYGGESPRYKIIDLYRPTVDFTVEDTDIVSYVPAPTDLAALSSKIVESISMLSHLPHVRIVIDSLSSIITLATPKATLRFLSFLKAKVQLSDNVILALLEPKLAGEAETEAILHLANTLILLEKDCVEIRRRGRLPVKRKIKIIDGGIKIAAGSRSKEKD